MSKIKSIEAREILDSRGNPTVEVNLLLKNGITGYAAVPSGASTGTHEALELRDKDAKRYNGMGVTQAVKNVNTILAPRLRGYAIGWLAEIDKLIISLDGTENKLKLGANAILGVSLAVARAAAADAGVPLYKFLRQEFFKSERQWVLPTPMMNIINGGAHAGWSVDIQEFMILPAQNKIKEKIRCGAEIFFHLKKILKENNYPTTVGDEGGFAPKLSGNEQAITYIMQAIKNAGYASGKDVSLGIDAAASEFYTDGAYDMKADKKKRTINEMVDLYKDWVKKYPIRTIEDGLAEDDWDGWKKLTDMLGQKINLIGDDLFVTNVARIEKGIKMGVANAVLIKLNQIGSLSETVEAIKLAKKNGYAVAISHRSGETSDDFISDLAAAANAEFLKAGSLSRGERVVKYNRLMKIEEELSK